MTPEAGIEAVLARLAHPYDAVKVASALLGLPARLARQLVGVAVATSEEAEQLLEAMPRIVRSMAIATTDRPQRCYGELRGPVLWSETMSARSASAGDPGLYVCATTTKAYDTAENRVLKAALAAIQAAGADADAASLATLSVPRAEQARRARHNGQRAAHLLEHRTLADVPVTRVTGRALRRTRAGSRRGTYHPAVAMVLRAASPLRAADLLDVTSAASEAQIRLFAGVLDELEHRHGATQLRSSHGRLVGGPVAYDHLAGVTVGDAPVTSAGDIAAALERAEAAPTA
ncbi:MAG TPA: hypothetical protein VFV32_06805 [Acidimicrobiales bacterium]|nr:hypothetical protein [Acidimicrobiales bacterium]